MGAICIAITLIINTWLVKITQNTFNLNFKNKFKIIKFVKFIYTSFINIWQSCLFMIKNIINDKDIFNKTIEVNLKEIKNKLALGVVAHSITVTPGSIVINQISKQKFLIHCLYKDIYDEMENFQGQEKILKLFDKNIEDINIK